MPAPLSPSATRQLLDQLGHHPRKRLGQNFLIDGNIVRKSVELAQVQPGDVVVEVGPGLGTLTGALLEAGAAVHAVELDARLATHLRETVQSERFSLKEGDAVDFPCGEGVPEGSAFKVVANLPYAITTPWLDALLSGPLPERMVLMMQKEAADRLTADAGGGDFGAISIFLQSAYRAEGQHPVSRKCFYPVPGVDSVLLVLAKRSPPQTFAAPVRAAIRSLFTQRRKQAASLVRGDAILEPWWHAVSAEFALSPTIRAEAIPLPAWQRLADKPPAARTLPRSLEELRGGWMIASPQDMEAVGAALAETLSDDQWLCLAGDLGAGKTTFARGFARGLGVREDVTSPTFAIYSLYQGTSRQLLHMDAYRLHGPDDIEALMLDDFLRSPYAVLLEWPERIATALPPEARFLQFESIDEHTRRLTLLDGPPKSTESNS